MVHGPIVPESRSALPAGAGWPGSSWPPSDAQVGPPHSSPKRGPARLLYIVNIYVYVYVYKSKSLLLQILANFSPGSEIQIAI
jgi:hypothetical protein